MRDVIKTAAAYLLYSFMPDGYVRMPYTRVAGAGTARRHIRERKEAKAQEARLRGVNLTFLPEIPSRQLRRQADRKGWHRVFGRA